MLDRIIRYSLRHRTLVVAGTAFVVVYGWVVMRSLPVDVFPDLNRPTVNIITDVPGMAPEEIEVVVTRPIETVLNGMPGVTRLFSSSAVGLSVVRVQFEWGTELKSVRLAVAERLQLAKSRLPKNVTPLLSPTSSIMGEIQMIGVVGKDDTTSLADLRTIADWTIRPRLLMVPGVSQVISIGGNQRQIQVLLNSEKLRQKNVSIHELESKIAGLSEASGGGFITQGDKEWLIRNFGRIRNYDEIPNTAVGRNLGIPILLKDLGRVDFAPAPKRGDASVNGKRAVIVMVQKQPQADTLEVTKKVDLALEEIRPGIQAGVEIYGDLFKQSDFINAAVGNVEEALRDGSIMVAIVLILFLLNFRTTVITLTAIPLSFFITAIVFKFFGLGVNTMTLGGLAIAIGE